MLRTTFELADLEPDLTVDCREGRGTVRFRVSRTATLEEAMSALSEVTAECLAGGQWFQLWKGEIVTVDSPLDPSEEGTVARLHRGPLVQEGSTEPERPEGEANTG